jgi:hypothetical protein
MRIIGIAFRPLLAIGRLGGASSPTDNYAWRHDPTTRPCCVSARAPNCGRVGKAVVAELCGRKVVLNPIPTNVP